MDNDILLAVIILIYLFPTFSKKRIELVVTSFLFDPDLSSPRVQQKWCIHGLAAASGQWPLGQM